MAPIVVIGEGQKAVDEATKILRSEGYDAESMMYPKNQWKAGRITKENYLNTVKWNKEWLKEKIKAGYTFVDIGPDGRSNPSDYYLAEQEAIKETKGKRIKIKKFKNGESVSAMRNRVKCS